MIDPSSPYTTLKGNKTFSKGSSGMANRIPEIGGTRQPIKSPHIPVVATARPKVTVRPTPKPTTRPTPVPFTRFVTKPATTQPALKPVTRRPPVTRPPTPPPTPPKPVTTRMPRPPTKEPPRVSSEAPPHQGFTVDNRIPIDPQKPRGDVFSK